MIPKRLLFMIFLLCALVTQGGANEGSIGVEDDREALAVLDSGDTTDVTCISVTPASMTSLPDGTIGYGIVLDTAPRGLSGYNLTILVQDGSIGEIVDVQYPSWVDLPSNSTVPADSVWCKAADFIGDSGTTDITLANVTVRADTVGSTTIAVIAQKVEDRVGGKYTPVVMNATLQVSASPIVDFEADPTSGTVPLTVQFTSWSTGAGTGNPEEWHWSFDDGGTSTGKNPTHTYDLPGNYTVTLSVDNGCSTAIKPSYIKVTPVLFGDANEDREVNQADTLTVLQGVVGLREQPLAGTEQFQKMDVHANGVIEVSDALFIAQHNVGLRNVWFALS